jgi:hypothetical protein
MGADSVWLGDRHQGFVDIYEAGCNGIAGLPPEVLGFAAATRDNKNDSANSQEHQSEHCGKTDPNCFQP